MTVFMNNFIGYLKRRCNVTVNFAESVTSNRSVSESVKLLMSRHNLNPDLIYVDKKSYSTTKTPKLALVDELSGFTLRH